MESRQAEIYGAVTITFIASTSALVLRLIARRSKKLTLWYDDYLAIVAWAAALAYDIGTFIWLELGLGLHLGNLRIPDSLADHYRELFQFILEQAYTVSIAGSQLSLLALYWRAFGPVAESRVCILIIATCSIIWFLCRIFIVTFQCNPPEAKWSYSVEANNCPIDTGKFFLATVSTHLVIDVLLMILPAWQIRKLHLPLLEKISITALFFFGCVVCFSSAKMMSAGITYDAQSPDVFWLETDPAMWSAVEINLSVVTACLPLMRPLFQRLGCCMERKASSAASARNGSYEMTKLPSAARAMVQTLEDANIDHPTRPPVGRAVSVDGRTFWPVLARNDVPRTSLRHASEPSGGNRELLA
ncbi:hypothetical protein PG987_001108 [Apiospora arundinis]